MVNTEILLHKLWSLKLNWDEEIPVEMKNLLLNIVEDLLGASGGVMVSKLD